MVTAWRHGVAVEPLSAAGACACACAVCPADRTRREHDGVPVAAAAHGLGAVERLERAQGHGQRGGRAHLRAHARGGRGPQGASTSTSTSISTSTSTSTSTPVHPADRPLSDGMLPDLQYDVPLRSPSSTPWRRGSAQRARYARAHYIEIQMGTGCATRIKLSTCTSDHTTLLDACRRKPPRRVAARSQWAEDAAVKALLQAEWTRATSPRTV